MQKILIVFFGTHTFAATILKALLTAPFIDVALVITQPDRPIGRTQKIQKSPVKLLAEERNLQIDQPSSLKGYSLTGTYDLGIVAQYGLLIPKHILDTPTHGTLNVHTSLLPKYRGASPIQHALIHGETETGITIMLLDAGMDTGPIISQRKISIDPDDTYEILDRKLAAIGSEALLESIPAYVTGKLTPAPQDDSRATVTSMLSRDDGQIDWTKSATEIYNVYRGLTPWPGVWTTWQGKRLKLLSIQPTETTLRAGAVAAVDDAVVIGCGAGAIKVTDLQLEGKNPMTASVFLNGYRTIIDTVLPS